ncbi:putative thiamine-phosphate diphosphorylase [Roseburia sp. CAG:309]|nr:putative thiamine-phosphate diphosphorylase [Roseburia sp. CAG:309]
MAIRAGKQNIPCICVTNRTLCRDDFLTRIDHIAKKGVADAILLREKDLTEREYLELAEKVLSICKSHNRRCILHTYYKAAKELGCKEIHLPLPLLQKMREEGAKEWFTTVGTSVHSLKQANLAMHLQADYMTAGHIFETDCKKGLPGRGLSFLSKVVCKSEVPVYGIGGISADNAGQVMETGAAGVCIMSGFMLESMN